MNSLYDMIFKRKSIRRFDEKLKISQEELGNIKQKLNHLEPLVEDIKVSYKIVKREETNCRWNGEYCLLVYSEEKENYLLNVGYMIEQLDLYMASINVGVCWYGWGKTDEKEYEGKKFVIMLTFGKSKVEDFRTDINKIKRKDIESIWKGEIALEVASAVRYAPSAHNSQPWRVKGRENNIEVYRTADMTSILSKGLVNFYNKIDMGIFMCFMDVSLRHFGYCYEKKIAREETNKKIIPVAYYILKKEV